MLLQISKSGLLYHTAGFLGGGSRLVQVACCLSLTIPVSYTLQYSLASRQAVVVRLSLFPSPRCRSLLSLRRRCCLSCNNRRLDVYLQSVSTTLYFATAGSCSVGVGSVCDTPGQVLCIFYDHSVISRALSVFESETVWCVPGRSVCLASKYSSSYRHS